MRCWGKGREQTKIGKERETKYGFKDAQRTEGQKHRGTDFQGRQTNMSLSAATAALAADQLHTGGGMRHHPERVVELFLFLRDYSKHQDLLVQSPTFPLLLHTTHSMDSLVCL